MNYDVKRAALIEYLKVKTAESDWHGVSDAANDLRVLEAQRPTMSAAEMYIKWRPAQTDRCHNHSISKHPNHRCILDLCHVGHCQYL